jgi:asparagine synthase (glutamine-hydrolysing)
MCGIFALLNNNTSMSVVESQFIKGQNRGPEFSKLDDSYMKMVLGFHRLAINGLNTESNQPLVVNDIVLICNGEIYNYKQLYKYANVSPVTDSDCEVIIHLYLKYGMAHTLTMLDGVFSFILYDNRIHADLNNKLFVARDPFGVRPLYYLKNSVTNVYGFASELKCLQYFYNLDPVANAITHISPGTYTVFNLSSTVNAKWLPEKENVSYFIPSFSHSWLIDNLTVPIFIANMYPRIASYLLAAVNKRCLATDRPIACLLSGGLDSSLITALVNNFYKSHLFSNKLETYSIGLEGSEDLKYARIVAEYLDTDHTEIIVTEQEMFDAIPEVIHAIESYDTTTVRASIGNYLLGKYIAKHSKAKVIFNGDGSDELLGGYLYMNKCPDDIEFDCESRRLLKDIHLFDVLRSDKSISSNGLEPRTPFLDRSFVNFVLSIPPYFRNHKHRDLPVEKYILRHSFSLEFITDFKGRSMLPDEILWRKKEAFSDGISSKGRSLYAIFQEKIAELLNMRDGSRHLPTIDTEKMYYKQLFESYFPKCSSIVPYYWMPKYVETNDPSARTLDLYS